MTEEQQYRLLDVLYAQLETTDRVRHQLLRLRNDQAKLRAMTLQNSVVIVLFMVVAAIPALWALLPDEFRLKNASLWVLALLALVYLVLLVCQLVGNCGEKKSLKKMLPAGAEATIEEQPEFLLAQMTSWGTRLSAAHEVLRKPALDGNVRVKFESVIRYCTERLDDLSVRVETLRKDKKLDDAEYGLMLQWLETARSHAPEEKHR